MAKKKAATPAKSAKKKAADTTPETKAKTKAKASAAKKAPAAAKVTVASVKSELDALKATLETGGTGPSAGPEGFADLADRMRQIVRDELADSEARIAAQVAANLAPVLKPLMVRIETARAELRAAVDQQGARMQTTMAQMAASLVPLIQHATGDVRTLLHIVESASASASNIIDPDEIAALFGENPEESGLVTETETPAPTNLHLVPQKPVAGAPAPERDEVLDMIGIGSETPSPSRSESGDAGVAPSEGAESPPSKKPERKPGRKTEPMPGRKSEPKPATPPARESADDHRPKGMVDGESEFDLDADELNDAHTAISQPQLKPVRLPAVAEASGSGSGSESGTHSRTASGGEMPGNARIIQRNADRLARENPLFSVDDLWQEIRHSYPDASGGRAKFAADLRVMIDAGRLPSAEHLAADL